MWTAISIRVSGRTTKPMATVCILTTTVPAIRVIGRMITNRGMESRNGLTGANMMETIKRVARTVKVLTLGPTEATTKEAG
jgi:hypothetical protein